MPTNERICPGCNAVVSEGSKFCPNCGAKIETDQIQQPPAAEDIADNDAVTEPSQESTNEIWTENAYDLDSADEAGEDKKKGSLGKILAGLSAVGIVAAAVLVCFLLLTKGKSKDFPYVLYIKDWEINISQLSNIKPRELTSRFIEGDLFDEEEKKDELTFDMLV